MFEILKNMMKEEWRMHSDIFGSIMFTIFPISLIFLSFLSSLFFPIFKTLLPFEQMATAAHLTFFLFGVSVGAFGLFGREVMNRRFGHASLIAYSFKSLPLSERIIFLNFFIKDVIYYFILWILPFAAGFLMASPFISISHPLLLFLTLTLSFLIGLSLIFFFSTIYAHSSKFFIGILAILIIAIFISHQNAMLLPSLSLFLKPSLQPLIYSLLLIIIPSSLSILFLKVDYPERKKRFKNSFDKISRLLKFSKYSHFISKDFLDLYRSEGGIGKIIFSFIFPIIFIWIILAIFSKFVPVANNFLLFSILLGILSSSIYNWLTEFDSFTSYSFLPVKVSTVVKSKFRSYALINLISFFILLFIAAETEQLYNFLPSLLAFASISSYALSVTVYLAGIYPNILLYNPKIFFGYMFLISPILLILILISVINSTYLLLSPLLFIPSFYLIKSSYKNLDTWERPNF